MALTFDDATIFDKKSIKLNWLVQLFYDDESVGDFFGLAYSDTTVDDKFYKGAIINKASIRESIDLENSTANTSNVSFNVANFIDDSGKLFSERIYGGSDYSSVEYINRQVKIWIQPDDIDTTDSCLQIYQGKLINISHTIGQVTLDITAKRVWDDLVVPSASYKTTNNIYRPIVYGDYTDAGTDEDDYPAMKTHPIKYCTEINRQQFYLTGQGSNGTKGALYWDKYLQQYSKIDDSSSTSGAVLSQKALGFPIGSTRSTKFYLTSVRASSESPGSDSGWLDTANLFQDSGFAYLPAPAQSSGDANKYLYINCPNFDGEATSLTLTVQTQFLGTIGGASGCTCQLFFNDESGSSNRIGVETYSTNETHIFSINILSKYNSNGKKMPEYLKFQITFSGVMNPSKQFRVEEPVVNTTYSYPDDATRRLDNKTYDFLYSGADGEVSTINESPITEIHEAHRDILHRHTSYIGSNTPINWSSGTNLDGTRDWKIRCWILEPTPLIEVLEKLQYEGGFIFRFNSQGDGQYIYIPNSVNENHTLQFEDIQDVEISLTSLNSAVTKMEIEYEKHPAEDRYDSSVTAVNSSARTKLRITSNNENVKRVKLDANVSAPSTSPGTRNNDFYTYYDKIIGEPKIIIKFTVVNPKFFNIDVGDIITLILDSEIKAFAYSYGDKEFWIVTDIARSLDNLKLTLREV